MRFHSTIRAVAAISLLGAPSLQAAVASAAVAATPRPEYVEPFNSGSVTQLLSGLLLVIALILALAWFFRRYSGLPGQSRGLKVIASLPLSSREKLVLVQAGEKQLLLGVAPGRVSLIESYDQPLLEPSQAAGDFAARLQQVMSRKNAE